MRLTNYYVHIIILTFTSLVLLTIFYKPYHSTDEPVDPSFLSEEVNGTRPILINSTVENVNACFIILIRNRELKGIMSSIRQLEDRFNKRFNYPYVMLNDEPFTDEFKGKVQTVTNSKIEFGLVPKEHWSYPSYIDQDKAAALREKNKNNYVYGGSESYRHMCRFFSGFFFRHNLTLKYDYYWRVEPDVQFTCDIKEDPFQRMKKSGGMYGFTISLEEIPRTIPTLWSTIKEWKETSSFGKQLPSNNALKFISSTLGYTYNTCHFWTNFEIGNFKLWRSDTYRDYFEFLDKKGGFFYERWGDAPVHSIYASLALSPSQIIYFEDIGYKHDDKQHCPKDLTVSSSCHCNTEKDYKKKFGYCARRWISLYHS